MTVGRTQTVMFLTVLLCLVATVASAQGISPITRVLNTFVTEVTGPIARGLTLIAVVVCAVGVMFGQPGMMRALASVALGGAIALGAFQILAMLT